MINPMHVFQYGDTLIGRTDDGERVYVRALFEPLELRATYNQQTTQHLERTGQRYRFSIQGHTIEKHRRNASSAGQIIEDLRRAKGNPVPGITRHDVEELARIWDRWHLNDMNGLCAHQPRIWTRNPHGYRVLDFEAIGPCPFTGYRPGSAWLYEEPDAADMERARDILHRAQDRR